MTEPEHIIEMRGAQPSSDLARWWRETSESDLVALLPKVGEYTAMDLILMGDFMEQWLGLPAGSGGEAACLFYALGKLARAVSSYKEGRLPSSDGLLDLTAYSLMARRWRDCGGWPNGSKP